MGTLIVVGVIVLVLAVFVGLVWLFVRLSRPGQPPAGPQRSLRQLQTAAQQQAATQKAAPPARAAGPNRGGQPRKKKTRRPRR